MSWKKNLDLTLLFLASICNIINVQALGTWSEIEIESVENAKGQILNTHLTSKRHDEESFSLSGPVEFVTDFDNNWELELVFLYSKDKSKFSKLPYSVPKDDLCKIVDGIVVKSGIAKDIAEGSDIPAPKEKEGVCAFYKKGNYTMKDLIIKKSVIPKILQPGHYRGEGIFTKKNSDETETFRLNVKLK